MASTLDDVLQDLLGTGTWTWDEFRARLGTALSEWTSRSATAADPAHARIRTRGDDDESHPRALLRHHGDDQLGLQGIKDSLVRFLRSGQDITLVIAPSATGGSDGGSVTLLSMDPRKHSGVETVVLSDASWSAADIRAKALAAAATAGNDTISGFKGDDLLQGGAGNDSYVIDSKHDSVVEKAGEGTDTVYASVSYTLAENVENLILTGSGNLKGRGNALDNVLTGNAGRNALDSGAGNDTLDGGAGADRMTGGAGNDTYIVDNAKDRTIEREGEGTDTVKSSVSWTLAANIENLTLTGSAALHGTGNALDNVITGNAGDNILTGGGGHDSFVFAGSFGHDTITDFQPGAEASDVLHLSLGAAFDSFAEVIAAAHEANGDTVLDFGNLGTVTLEGVQLSKLAAGDFVFA